LQVVKPLLTSTVPQSKLVGSMCNFSAGSGDMNIQCNLIRGGLRLCGAPGWNLQKGPFPYIWNCR